MAKSRNRTFVRMAAGAVASLALLAAGPGGASPPERLEGFVARLRALALLQSLNNDLLTHDSATATLQRWCDAHLLAPGERIVADRVAGEPKDPGPEVLAVLGARSADQVRYRHVRLRCGAHVLSDADNWYRPDRLSRDMNRVLEHTDTPFGVAVRETRFTRRTIRAELLFQPLPLGWETGSPPDGDVQVPWSVIRHRAVLTTRAGKPFSVVEETYTAEVLATAP